MRESGTNRITSPQNERIKAAVRLSKKSERDETGISFITEQGVIDKILRHIGFRHADTLPPRYHPRPSSAGRLSGEPGTPRTGTSTGHASILTRNRIANKIH